MASSSNHGAANGKQSRVLLPFTRDSLRIPDELAEEIGTDEALVAGPPAAGKQVKFWAVEVGTDGDGAFLGVGWLEFAEACGVEAGWHLVLRHRGRGVLTVKVFDASNCLLELGGAPVPAAVEARESSKDAARSPKPQFIRVFSGYFMEKLLIPHKFVRHYIRNNEHLNSHTATVLGPIGKVSQVELEKNGSDEFFVGGWSQFLVSNNITETDSLLLSYGGKMEFVVKVFDPKGYQRESKHKETRAQLAPTSSYIEEQEQQETPPISIPKHCKNNWPRPSSDGEKKRQAMVNPLNEEPLWTKPIYQIGSSSQMKKQINANTLKELALAKHFCDAIGLHCRSTITLKTSMSSTDSWKVQAVPCKNMSYRLMKGWRRFCLENRLKQGDICTIEVTETTLWHVTINHMNYETPASSNRKHDAITSESSNNGQKRRKRSSDALITDYVSARGCVFAIGPPAWIKKEINSTTFETRVYLPPVFCKAIGIQEPCKITLKTSMSNTRSAWQAHIALYEGSSYHVSGPGWRQFCRENRIKVGDVCTINIVETKLWHVIVNSSE
ncbi:unnamed protein product [Urochloa decumbens]|uniref:TF-B3 domain-containing protein n=1 Tax=Urochloa decumbens TaxID=240449 RepID=A0ABC9CYF7_9POAL